jgi:short-subunit dehydrogenase
VNRPKKNVLILGANSDVAKELCRGFAREGYDLDLASRDLDCLERLAEELRGKWDNRVDTYFFDVLDFNLHDILYANLKKKPDIVIAAFGYLGDQNKGQEDFAEAQKIINTNYLSVVKILEIVAEDFSARRCGTIVGITSVAGERGRGGNYLYGSAKSGLTTYLSGLRNRLAQHNISVITVIAGFIRTKMTEGMNLPSSITAEPHEVAEDILRAIRNKKDVIYSKWYWKYIMLMIRMIPEKIFKKMKL